MITPTSAVRIPAAISTSQIVRWMPPTCRIGFSATEPTSKLIPYAAKCGEASHAAVYAPIA